MLSKGKKKWKGEEGKVLKIISQGKSSLLPEKKSVQNPTGGAGGGMFP